MERILVTVSSDLFDEPNQEASLRKNLSVRNLIGEVQKEFNLPEGHYAVRAQGQTRPLELDKSMDQLGILSGAQLIFSRERRSVARAAQRPEQTGGRRMITGPNLGYLIAETNNEVFEIVWDPAIIGRPEANNPASAQQLAVNLGTFEEARTVSRQHARITERNGTFFLESLQAHNLARLNDEEIQVFERRRLHDGDKLLVGKITLTFKAREAGGDSGPTSRV